MGKSWYNGVLSEPYQQSKRRQELQVGKQFSATIETSLERVSNLLGQRSLVGGCKFFVAGSHFLMKFLKPLLSRFYVIYSGLTELTKAISFLSCLGSQVPRRVRSMELEFAHVSICDPVWACGLIFSMMDQKFSHLKYTMFQTPVRG